MSTGSIRTPARQRPRGRRQVAHAGVEIDLEPGRPGQRRQPGRGEAAPRSTAAPVTSRARRAVPAEAEPEAELRSRGAGDAGGRGQALARQRRSRRAGREASSPASPSRSRTTSPAAPWRRRPSRAASYGVEALGEERADRAGQDVAGAAGREGRVLERRPGRAAVRGGDDGPGALEHDDLAPARGRVRAAAARGLVIVDEVAVGAGLDPAGRPQPGELAGMRREHARSVDADPPAVRDGQRAERLGVDDRRRRRRRPRPPAAAGSARPWPGPAGDPGRRPGRRARGPGSWPARPPARPPRRRPRAGAIVVASTTLAANSGWSDSGTARVTRPAPARPAARQTSRAAPGVVERAGDHQQLAERALVAAGRPLGQQRRDDPRRVERPVGARRPPRRRLAGRRVDRARSARGASGRVGASVSRGDPRQGPEPVHPGQDPPLALVEPGLDVRREDVPAAGRSGPRTRSPPRSRTRG